MDFFVFSLTLLFVALIYTVYQGFRNDKVLKIRLNWIWTMDMRRYRYTYDEMFKPSLKNWFGLKWPRDKDFL